jgi:hypothetical protein
MERLMSPSKVRAPAKVWQTKPGAIGEIDAKPKLHQSRSGNSEVFGEGHYLCRKGPNGNTLFDTCEWTGESPSRRGA